MRETTLTEFATVETAVRHFLNEYSPWIRATLGCQAEDVVQLEVDFPIVQAAASHLLPGVRLRSNDSGTIRKLGELVESVDVPQGLYPTFDMRLKREARGPMANRTMRLEAEWQDLPVALQLRGLPKKIVAVSIPYIQAGRNNQRNYNCVLVGRNCTVSFLQIIRRMAAQRECSYLHVFGSGHQRVGRLGWDDLVLSSSVSSFIRDDFETFFDRESWFKTRRLPFRRGYFFHGPPGNGKTSVIRAMLNSGKLDGHSIALSSEKTDDYYLDRMFQLAASSAPSLVVLEDIDRAFPQDSSQVAATKVSLSHLLNCLDGLGTQEGIIVVATANDPTALDPAILRRPGRFDRVVEFPGPDHELRATFLRKFLPNLLTEELQRSVNDSDGFSFAQLREAYILAGQHAYERDSEVTGNELHRAICALRSGMGVVLEHKAAVGFLGSGEGSAMPRLLNRTI
jgi:hypothetical protein